MIHSLACNTNSPSFNSITDLVLYYTATVLIIQTTYLLYFNNKCQRT